MILDYKNIRGPVNLFIDLNVIYYRIRWLGDLGNEGKIRKIIRCHTQQEVSNLDPSDGLFICYSGSTRTAVAAKHIQLSTDFELIKVQ
jgi:hypothetical protein